MSMCIILVRHHSRFIVIYMGNLRFTLTNVIFWIVLLLSCFLSEDFAFLNGNPLKGFSIDSAFILTLSILGMLVLYYFLEHKKNKLTFDKILLPSFIISGLFLILNVFRQGTITFIYLDGQQLHIKFPLLDRFEVALQIIVWLAVIYAMVFVYNRFRLNKESIRWVGKIYLIVILLCCVIDLFMEGHHLVEIIKGEYTGGGFEFLMGNENVWSLLIFSGFLTAVILSYKGFKWYYYAALLGLFTYNLLTTCTITTILGVFIILAYTTYEILSRYKEDKRLAKKRMIIFYGIIFGGFGLFSLLAHLNVPIISSFWHFNKNLLLYKDIFSLSNRLGIWRKVIWLIREHPLDVIFGLGHKTANALFFEYTGGLRSAHNGFMEILLRYGVVGLSIYVGMIGLVIYSLVLHSRRKNYRFAFIYGFCFIAIIGHSMIESTTLFTPNVGGLYFSFVFVLPILSILQEKRFKELKQDLLTVKVSKEKIRSTTPLNIIILVAASIVIGKIISIIFSLDAFTTILMALVMFIIGLIIIYLIIKRSAYNPYKIAADNNFIYYQELIRKENDNE